jgi:hypothetical protein
MRILHKSYLKKVSSPLSSHIRSCYIKTDMSNSWVAVNCHNYGDITSSVVSGGQRIVQVEDMPISREITSENSTFGIPNRHPLNGLTLPSWPNAEVLTADQNFERGGSKVCDAFTQCS